MQTATQLVAKFNSARLNPNSLSQWKRQLTLYCNQRSSETGQSPVRFRAAVKGLLTRKGYSTASV